jgi:glycosyltransferase involved in cell wall biosynthesis
MRICHVTPHLPPDQGANALLPFHLGNWASEAGDEVTYLAHERRQAQAGAPTVPLAGPVTWLTAPGHSGGVLGPLASVAAARQIARAARPVLRAADVIHIHSNGLLPEVCAWVAAREGKPCVLTLYGTEIWHYHARRWPDLFTRAYRSATLVTFYSHGLMERAKELGLNREGLRVSYPPVTDEFREASADARAAARAALGFGDECVLVNVKRLHPLAGQRYLIEAMPEILRRVPETHLIICGTGRLAPELQSLASSLGMAGHITFTGLLDNRTVARYDTAADLFVLPSLLEACPTVALEALACGTPIVSSDNPGGVELSRMFGDDVVVVPRKDPAALADAVAAGLQERRRTKSATAAIVERELRLASVGARFRSLYEEIQGSKPRDASDSA